MLMHNLHNRQDYENNQCYHSQNFYHEEALAQQAADSTPLAVMMVVMMFMFRHD